MAEEQKEIAKRQDSPIDRMKKVIYTQSVQEQFKNALDKNAPLFIASLIEAYGADSKLQKCEPKLVIMEALKAATLRLPINKQLGYAWLIPYDQNIKVDGKWTKASIPQFQIGYKGYIQLAMRTGQYRYINAGELYEGHIVERDLLTGSVSITGQAKSDKAIAYFAYLETINGFEKAICWTKEEVQAHAKRYSKSYGNEHSPWTTEFDKMAIKTMIRNLLGHYGIMSIEMANVMANDNDERSYDDEVQREVDEQANTGPVIDVEPVQGAGERKTAPPADTPSGNSGEAMPEGPDF